MSQNIIVAAVCLLLGVGGATAYFTLTAPADTAADASATEEAWCAEHKIAEADCPFCNLSIIEERGHCAEHDVAEGLCYQCNPKLMAAFKAEGDWCAGHNVPESQCALCDYGAIHEGPNAKPKE